MGKTSTPRAHMSKQRAVVELLIADIFWGSAFVAVPFAQKSWDSAQISFIRFFIPVVLGLLLGLYSKAWKLSREEIRMGLIPGFFFAATIYSQTIGLEYTTPSRSGFVTVLYIIFVPLLETYMHKKRLPVLFWLSIVGALVGMGFLLNLDWSEWNIGDTITFSCALFSTWHIYQVGLLGKKFKHPILFNLSQCLWAAIFLFPFAIMSHQAFIPPNFNYEALIGLGVVTFGATMIAFSIQARVQAFLSASMSSVLFLLEAPIAMFFSWWLLSEVITVNQLLGALLILVSCVGAIFAHR